jgi:hypothetical protein
MKTLYASDLIAPLSAAACALAGLALVRFGRAAAPALAAGVALVTAVMAFAGAETPGGVPGWRPALLALNERFAGERVLVTPRPAGAMARYYLRDVETVLDSSAADDVAVLNTELAADGIDSVIRWGKSVEPGGAAGTVVRQRPPDGTTTIGGTVVSWWTVE